MVDKPDRQSSQVRIHHFLKKMPGFSLEVLGKTLKKSYLVSNSKGD